MTIIYTTCGNKKEAEKIARALLRDKLAACVNIWPVRSVWWWKGKIEEAGEWALMCKTRKALAVRVERRIRALHSYKMPVIEQWETQGVSKGVKEWIEQVTKPLP